MRIRSLAPLSSLALLAGTALAQGPAPAPVLVPSVGGVWLAPFNHDVSTFAHPPVHIGGAPVNPEPGFNAIHMALVPVGPHRGQVFVMDREERNQDPATQLIPNKWIQRYALVDASNVSAPAFHNHTLVFDEGEGDLFCAGHSWAHDGRLLVAGGTTKYGAVGAGGWTAGLLLMSFDPLAPGPAGWQHYPDLSIGRWYPTITMMGDLDAFGYQRYLILGGTDGDTSLGRQGVLNDYEALHVNAVQERLDPNRYKGPFFGTGIGGTQIPAVDRLGLYPRTITLSNGQIMRTGISDRHALLTHQTGVNTTTSTSGTTSWQALPESSRVRRGGSSILAPNVLENGTRVEDRVILIGGKRAQAIPPTDEVEVLDALSGASAWTVLADPMGSPRWRQNTVILPDASLLVVGGNANAQVTFDGKPVLDTELLTFDDQGVADWTMLNKMSRQRTYHAATVLLPDGRVLVGGGDTRDVTIDANGESSDPIVYNTGPSDYQIYEPPYLHLGLERPVITSLTEAVDYGTQITVGFAAMTEASVDKVVLIRPGSTTHHNDYDQRYFELDLVAPAGATSVTATVPTNRNQILPGYWMLFLLSDDGIPSEAGWIHVAN